MQKIITDLAGLTEVTQFIEQNTYLAYDIETTGLNPRKNSIIGFSVANEQEAYYIVHTAFNGTELLEVLPKHYLKLVVEQLAQKKLIMHNASFDTRFTIHYFNTDLRPALHCDTMLLEHTLNESGPFALKEMGAAYLGINATEEQQVLKAHLKEKGATDMYMADYKILGEYGAKDALLTFQLFKLREPELYKQSLDQFFYTDEVMPLLKYVTIDMELRGIPVDVAYMQQSKEEIEQHIVRLEAEIQAEIKPLLTAFNNWYIDTKYPFKLTGRFKEKLGARIAHELWPKTEKGTVSLNKTDIEKAKKLNTREVKKGVERPLLPDNTQFERIILGLERVPEQLIQEIQLELLQEDGVTYTFNLQSKDHLKRLFFGTPNTPSPLKEKPISTTEKGNPQVDDEFLETMRTKYKWADLLHIYNKLNKIKATYIERFLEGTEDGLFYPSFFQHRTISGRYGSDIQQLPRPLEAGQEHELVVEFTNRVRRFFIAPEGYTIIDDDYESLEPHVFAHVAGDEGLKNIFRNGHDFYSTIAIMTEGLTEYSADKKADNYLGKKNKAARQKSKAYCLGVPYGMSDYKLQYEINVDQKTAAKLIQNYMKAFPELHKWMLRSEAFAIEHGYIRTEAGRIRRFPEMFNILKTYGREILNDLELWKKYHETPATYRDAKEARQTIKNYLNNAKNLQIQSLGASIINRASIKLAQILQNYDARILAQIHDELIVLCKTEQVDEVKAIVQECMEQTYKISIPLKAVPSVGPNWAEAKG